MKLHRTIYVSIIVMLTIIVLVMPVSAGKRISPFTAEIATTGFDWSEDNIGAVSHYWIVITGDVDSVDGRLVGVMTWRMNGTGVLKNAHAIVVGSVWGPVNSAWRIITSTPGEPESGWEGTAELGPWTDPSFTGCCWWSANGTGFGIFKNMHVKWVLEADTLTMYGEVWE